MPRSYKKDRNSTANTITRFFTASPACRISVAIAASMQFPVFFASCDGAVPAERVVMRIDRKTGSGSALDVFVFEGEAPYLLDSYQQFPAGEEPGYVVSGPGAKRIVALSSVTGDIYSRAGISRYQDLAKESFSLLDDSPAVPFCYGEADVDEGDRGYVTLTLKPLLSSIRVKSVSCELMEPAYQSLCFHNDSLFLVNVVSEACPWSAEGGRPVSWLNYGFRSQRHAYIDAAGLGDIGHNRILCNKTFYCYPNPKASPPTRLVLEGTVKDYRCYYPINLPVPKGGTRLVLDIAIHRMGTEDPDSEAAPGTFSVEYTTEPWYDTDTQIQTF